MKRLQLILFLGKTLQFFSSKLATIYAIKLFGTVIKHKVPKREFAMNDNSIQKKILVSKINKHIHTYEYGKPTNQKVLLVHGWSGRGTQLFKIADELIKNGYWVFSFDAPSHGKSEGTTTLMPEFIASIHEMQQQFGPFECIIGHSMGGMTSLKAIAEGLIVKKAVVISSGDKIQDILDEFLKTFQFSEKIGKLMKKHYEKQLKQSMNSLSSYISAQQVSIPVLIIHDKNDDEIPLFCAMNIHMNLKGSELFVTEKLGHRKILGDQKVIEKIINFIQQIP